MDKMLCQEHRALVHQSAFDWHFGLPDDSRTQSHASRGSRERCAGADGDADDRRGRGVCLSLAPHGRGVQGFISEAHHERLLGNSFCFGIVPDGYDDAMGLFQVRQIEPGFGSAEWGFAIGSPFWGSGIFIEGAQRGHRFFVRRRRRASPRGEVDRRPMAAAMRALRKVGAIQEGILRRSFQRKGRFSIRSCGRF